MENKYYTPEITDIRVGYECEIWMPQNPSFDKWDWESFILQKNHFNPEQPFFPLIAKLRTPFLTKEQIGADGWEVYPSVMPNQDWIGFSKDNYMLVYYCFNNDISKPCIKILAKDVILLEWMGNFPEMFRVTLPCPSINEFRFICKLLKIN